MAEGEGMMLLRGAGWGGHLACSSHKPFTSSYSPVMSLRDSRPAKTKASV